MGLGMTAGSIFSVNLFIPLNSVDWLNKTFLFKNDPLTGPLLTNAGLLYILAGIGITLVIAVTFFVKEITVVDTRSPEKGGFCYIICTLFPQFFKNKYTMSFLFYMIMINLFSSMLGGVLSFKLISLGFDKTELTNQGTILLIPSILVLLIAGAFFMNKNKFLRTY